MNKSSCTSIDMAKGGSIAQHCMNCCISMHGALCGPLWGDIKCVYHFLSLSKRTWQCRVGNCSYLYKVYESLQVIKWLKQERANRLGNGMNIANSSKSPLISCLFS